MGTMIDFTRSTPESKRFRPTKKRLRLRPVPPPSTSSGTRNERLALATLVLLAVGLCLCGDTTRQPSRRRMAPVPCVKCKGAANLTLGGAKGTYLSCCYCNSTGEVDPDHIPKFSLGEDVRVYTSRGGLHMGRIDSRVRIDGIL